METATKRLYEAMFVVDSGQAAADWDGTLEAVNNVLKRADAEVLCLRKWGERKLAYEIAHKSRGTYILSYFRADTSRIGGIERDVQLSEKIMRMLVLSTEGRPPEIVERDIAGLPAESPQPQPAPAPPPPPLPGTVPTEVAAAEDIAPHSPDRQPDRPASDGEENPPVE